LKRKQKSCAAPGSGFLLCSITPDQIAYDPCRPDIEGLGIMLPQLLGSHDQIANDPCRPDLEVLDSIIPQFSDSQASFKASSHSASDPESEHFDRENLRARSTNLLSNIVTSTTATSTSLGMITDMDMVTVIKGDTAFDKTDLSPKIENEMEAMAVSSGSDVKSPPTPQESRSDSNGARPYYVHCSYRAQEVHTTHHVFPYVAPACCDSNENLSAGSTEAPQAEKCTPYTDVDMHRIPSFYRDTAMGLQKMWGKVKHIKSQAKRNVVAGPTSGRIRSLWREMMQEMGEELG